MKDNQSIKDQIIKEFQHYLLTHGEQPVTVYAFAEKIGIEENHFYDHFNSFKTIEKEIWFSFFQTVINSIENDKEFETFSAHEKVLSFHYTLLEVYKQNRSYITLCFKSFGYQNIRPWFMKDFHEGFNNWINSILDDGFKNNELFDRPFIHSKYNEALWLQLLYITKVWVNDESDDFQIADAAIEKSSALIFELMKKGPVDLLIDFIKFAYQNKAY